MVQGWLAHERARSHLLRNCLQATDEASVVVLVDVTEAQLDVLDRLCHLTRRDLRLRVLSVLLNLLAHRREDDRCRLPRRHLFAQELLARFGVVHPHELAEHRHCGRHLLVQLDLHAFLKLGQHLDGAGAGLTRSLSLLQVRFQKLQQRIVEAALPSEARNLALHHNGRRRLDQLLHRLRCLLHTHSHLLRNCPLDLGEPGKQLLIALVDGIVQALEEGVVDQRVVSGDLRGNALIGLEQRG